ncbi:MAG: SDR family oxidoreductase [Pseudomonadales bacterium]|jgi:NAD(P)-dependent dehydrogenase (short-subunit alcohol dehydrogenase family)|nr:SDR family oxidoreductase [Pseudomonadales bacterium]
MDFNNLFGVEGKVVCVTGGGGGIGRGIAGAFVAGGARVYITSRSDLQEAADELAEEGPGECIPLRTDLSNDEEITALGRTLDEREGKLDVLVNNAALGGFIHRFGELPMAEWDAMTTVNLRAPFALTQTCLPLLRAAANSAVHASVINIASVDGVRIAGDNDWAYGMGKAGLIHLTRQLAGLAGNKHGREGGHNITFNAVAPGPFPGMLDRYLETEEGRAAVGAVTVSGRVGKPEDIGAACIYLASRAGSYVSGVLLPVDGGLLVGKRANS